MLQCFFTEKEMFGRNDNAPEELSSFVEKVDAKDGNNTAPSKGCCGLCLRYVIPDVNNKLMPQPQGLIILCNIWNHIPQQLFAAENHHHKCKISLSL